MSKKTIQAAPPGNDAAKAEKTRKEFLASAAPPGERAFLDESQILARVPVSRRTWGNWKAKGLVPYIKIGRRCIYDWENVAEALRRLERGPTP